MLRTFAWSTSPALDIARRASGRLDGVFCFDHLWPMGSPGRPAIAPMEVLAHVAALHEDLEIGTLVGRIGLSADEIVLSQFRALAAIAPGRVIAALGTGDAKSRAENLAYGVDFAAPEERRASLRHVATTLRDEGLEVWIGDGAQATREIALAEGLVLNQWGRRPELSAKDADTLGCALSWAGVVRRGSDGGIDAEATYEGLCVLADAGVTYAVFGEPAPVELLGELRATLASRG